MEENLPPVSQATVGFHSVGTSVRVLFPSTRGSIGMVVRSKGVTFQFWEDFPFNHNPPAILEGRIVVWQTFPYFGDIRAMVQTFE